MDDDDDRRDGSGFPIELLVQALSSPSEDAFESAAPSHPIDRCEEAFQSLRLYPQAVPLIQPQSTAAVRTIGAMLGNPQVVQRMLQRNQPVDPSTVNVARRLQFHKTCSAMFSDFDPATNRSGTLPLHRIPLLLRHYKLEVDSVAYRQWEQTLPADCKDVTLLQFTQACRLWFKEQVLIDHWLELKRSRLALVKCESAPQLLHPFDAMERQQDAAGAFSYQDYARSPPKPLRSPTEKLASTSHAMIKATQQLRRKTKLLTLSNQHSDNNPPPLHQHHHHDRLHSERLARHILQRCGSQTLPSSPASPSHQQRRAALAAKKRARLQSIEATRAFSASVAMISRHVHNEELRDQRDLAHERQLAAVDDRRQLRRLQHAHCEALARERSQQQLRDVAAMKTLAEEEQVMMRQYLLSRQQLLRRSKQPFAVSASSSTLFPPPPEILAAKATAKTPSQQRKLQLLEKEHVAHMRTVQLLDYAYDKQRAVDAAREPKADASLLELTVDELPAEREQAIAADELWTQLLTESSDLSLFMPPANSPPAAVRFFHPSRAHDSAVLPPFTASTTTPSLVSKVAQH